MTTNDDATDGTMTCEVCGRTFPSREALQEHQREDHDMDPPADLAREVEDPPDGPVRGGTVDRRTPGFADPARRLNSGRGTAGRAFVRR